MAVQPRNGVNLWSGRLCLAATSAAQIHAAEPRVDQGRQLHRCLRKCGQPQIAPTTSRLQLCDGRSEELVDARLADPRILPGQGHSGGRSRLNSLRVKQNWSVGALALASGKPATVMPIRRRVRGRPSLTRGDLTMN